METRKERPRYGRSLRRGGCGCIDREKCRRNMKIKRKLSLARELDVLAENPEERKR